MPVAGAQSLGALDVSEYGAQAPDEGYAYSWNEGGYVTTEPE